MKMTAFRAVCPVEIGDEIFIIGDKAYYLVPGRKGNTKILVFTFATVGQTKH